MVIGKFVKQVLLFLISAIAFLEVSGFLVHKIGLKKFEAPSYDLDLSTLFKPNFHADIDPDFGVWHPSNTSKVLKGDCYEALYHSNSYGARDKERTTTSDKERFFVIGSSNLEGFGVDTTNRITNLIENTTGIEMMNFSVAGFFSPTQQYLVYKKYHQKFDHDYVLMGISFPGAFKEDDIEVWRERAARTSYWKRYRPYWVGDYPNYKLVHETESLEKSSYGLYPSAKKRKKDIQKNYSWFFNMLSNKNGKSHTPSVKREEGYETATQKEMERLFYSIEQVAKLAGDKKVFVFTVPTPGSVALFKKNHYPNYIQALDQRFNANSQTSFLYSEENLEIEDSSNFFLPCNRHWDKEGHVMMSSVVSKFITSNINSTTNDSVKY